MRILYDGGAFQEQGAGGIKRYFANLISGLPANFEPHLTTCRAAKDIEPEHPHLRIHRFRRFRPQRLSLRLEKVFFGRVEKNFSFDLAHPTYYTLLSQHEVSQYRCPVVITVWDMIHEIFPELEPTGQLVARKRRGIEAADAILCISENTRQDLLSYYKVDESKVLVTHLAANLTSTPNNREHRTPSRPYFLYVGARAGYKNFHGLLSAFAAAATSAPGIMLCVVGPQFSVKEEQQIAGLGLNGKVENYGPVSDSELAALYRKSLALVYASLYEGFGIPPLEAMQSGTLVIAADRSSIPEVVGNAGMLFDPDNRDALTDILVHVARNPEERQPFIERGYQRARQFTWDKTVRDTLEVYRNLVR